MSTISAGTTTTTALVQTGDTTGSLVLKTGSTPTTAMTINSSQIVNFNNAPTVGGSPLPSGAMSLISTQTLTGFTASSLQWTGLTGYNKYQLIWDNVTNDTGTMSLATQIGTGSGPTYLTSGYYYQAVFNNTGSAGASVASNVSNWYISKGFQTTNSTSGCITFTGMTNTNTAYFMGTQVVGAGPNYQTGTVGGFISSGAPVTAIQIFNYIGANLNGTFSLYGISS
jgi:hypothetical protein